MLFDGGWAINDQPEKRVRTCSSVFKRVTFLTLDMVVFSISSLITKSLPCGDRLSSRQPYYSTRSCAFPFAILMSATNQTAGPSTDNFTAIFNAAIVEYQTLTGKPLDTHPFATQLDTCQNPEAVLDLLRTQAQAFSKFRKGVEKLMTWLDPTIHILSAFSDTLGEGISLVSNPVDLYMTVVGRPVFSHSHLQRRFLRGSVFFSGYVFFQSLIAILHDI